MYAGGIRHEETQSARAHAGDWYGDGDYPGRGAGVSVQLLLYGGGVGWEAVGETCLFWEAIWTLRHGEVIERRHPREQRLAGSSDLNAVKPDAAEISAPTCSASRENISPFVYSAAGITAHPTRAIPHTCSGVHPEYTTQMSASTP